MSDDLKFDFNDDMDISSFSSNQNKKYEDIVSDTHYAPAGYGAQPAAKKVVYRKKKTGFAGFMSDLSYKIRRWWARLKKGQKRAVIAVSSIALAILLLVVWFFSVFGYNYRGLDKDNLGIDGVIDEKIVNVALFGIDSRDKDSFEGLSDSIMIMSLNTETKKVKIISLMRDTLVPIEKDGKTSYNKLTTAYKTGGPELAIKTINQCFGLDISEYATVNFYGMADIIDAVGGIDATLTEREVKARGNNNHGINDMIEEVCIYMDEDPKDYYITVSGDQHLNGIQAVAYARIRYVPNIWGTNNDYGRTDRQRYVMEQLFNKATKMKKSQYIKLAKALIPCSETSLSYSDILNLAVNILLHSPTFEQSRIPQDDWNMTAPNGSFGSVVYFDLDYAKDAIHSIIYSDLTMEQFVEQNPVEKNDWYANRGSSSGGGKPSSSGGSKPSGGTSSTTSQGSGSGSTTVPPAETGNDTDTSETASNKPSDNSAAEDEPEKNDNPTGENGGQGTETGGGTDGDTAGGDNNTDNADNTTDNTDGDTTTENSGGTTENNTTENNDNPSPTNPPTLPDGNVDYGDMEY